MGDKHAKVVGKMAMDAKKYKKKMYGLTRWNKLDRHPQEVDGLYQPSKGVRPYQIGKIGPPLDTEEVWGEYQPRREFDLKSLPRPYTKERAWTMENSRDRQQHVAKATKTIEKAMEKERREPLKYLHRSEHRDYVYRWDDRPPKDIIGHVDDDGVFHAGQGFAGSRNPILFNKVLGNDTVYTAETRQGAEIFLIESLMSDPRETRNSGDQHKPDDFTSHLYKIKMRPRDIALRMEDMRHPKGHEKAGRATTDGIRGLGSFLQQVYSQEQIPPKDYHRNRVAPETYSEHVIADGQMKARRYLMGVSKANKETIVSSIQHDRVTHLDTWNMPETRPSRADWQKHIIKWHEVDVNQKNLFWKKLQERVDDGEHITAQSLHKEADDWAKRFGTVENMQSHREKEREEEEERKYRNNPQPDTLD